MHPAAPDVYSVLHPMYWLLALSGREFERVPVVFDLGDVSDVDAQLVRRRLAYGRPRPDAHGRVQRIKGGRILRKRAAAVGIDDAESLRRPVQPDRVLVVRRHDAGNDVQAGKRRASRPGLAGRGRRREQGDGKKRRRDDEGVRHCLSAERSK